MKRLGVVLVLLLCILVPIGQVTAAKTVLQFWTTWDFNAGQGQALRSLVQKYNSSHPDVTIELLQVPQPEIIAKTTVAHASGETPALMYMAIEYARELSAIGALADPNALIHPAAWQQLTADFFPNTEMYLKHATFPYMVTTFVNQINVDMAEEAGLPLNSPPDTWAQFAAWAKKLTRESPDGKQPKVFGAGIEPWGWDAWAVMFRVRLMAWQWGTDVFTDGYRKTNLLDPAFVEAMSFWVNAAAEGWTGIKGKMGYPNNRTVAMKLNPGDNLAPLAKLGIRIHSGPEPKQVANAAHLGGQGWFVMNSAQAQTAADFVRWALQPEQHAAFWLEAQTGMVPATTATLRVASIRDAINRDQNLQMQAQMLQSYGRPAIPAAALGNKQTAEQLTQAETIIGDWIVKAVSQQVPLRNALEQATAQANAVLSQ